MPPKEIAQGNLLFHAVHGVCRVDEVGREGPPNRKVSSYSLVPKHANRMKVRFVIPAAEMELSGFHAPVSPKEAREILAYLETGDLSAECEEDRAWELAKALLASSRDDLGMKDARKRQMIERSARGLVGELAFVLKMTLKEAAGGVRKCLGDPSQVSPTVLTALLHAGEG